MLSWARHSHDANFSNQPLKPDNSRALLFQDFQSGSGIHFVRLLKRRSVCKQACALSMGGTRADVVIKSITLCVKSICCLITASMLDAAGGTGKPSTCMPCLPDTRWKFTCSAPGKTFAEENRRKMGHVLALCSRESPSGRVHSTYKQLIEHN